MKSQIKSKTGDKTQNEDTKTLHLNVWHPVSFRVHLEARDRRKNYPRAVFTK